MRKRHLDSEGVPRHEKYLKSRCTRAVELKQLLPHSEVRNPGICSSLGSGTSIRKRALNSKCWDSAEVSKALVANVYKIMRKMNDEVIL